MTAPAPIAEILMNCLRVAILLYCFLCIKEHCGGKAADLNTSHNEIMSEGIVY